MLSGIKQIHITCASRSMYLMVALRSADFCEVGLGDPVLRGGAFHIQVGIPSFRLRCNRLSCPVLATNSTQRVQGQGSAAQWDGSMRSL